MHQLNEEITQLYRDHFAQVVAMFRKGMCTSEDSRDLAQEVFTLYFNKRLEGAAIPDPCAWLFYTTKLHLLNHNRECWNTKVDISDNPPKRMDAELLKLCHESYAICEEIILKEMSGMQRSVFVLVGLHRFSYAQAGKELNLSEHQVASQYKIACRVARTALNKKGIFSPRELL